ncbi:MAG: phenylalanine--tRNA ligase subunit alpha [Patescibacteria group bacterium]|nr:phenylalanine--tRNA ligase subunit alpha [Patescibacteria group bacterium]MDE2116743.1 phenylalanine--tRNA ligase subunit alpha [Patescibacteria group bacterium]
MNSEAPAKPGHLHPVTSAIREMCLIFGKLGFSVAQGPELEDEFHNFDALNVPPDHPARDMQDTFWIKTKPGEKRHVLRTHTSSVQIRFMEAITQGALGPQPFKIVIPGKVYRNEATDATHEAQFYQLEGLYVNKTVSMAELKWVLERFFKEFLGPESKIRFRSSYFGFVEPGVEVDVWFRGKWLEVVGAGIVHPKVFSAAGLDPNVWKGFAFGFGVERLVLMRYGIDDIRHLYSGDLRLINQF